MKEQEGAILLERSPSILLTVDSIQSYATAPHKPHTNLITRLLMPLIGVPNETLIGPAWIKLVVEDREGIKAEFERLLEYEFDQLLSAHGTFLPHDAHAQVARAFKKMFG